MQRQELFLRRASVALVGPSLSVIGSGFGSEIERHDVVARLNHQWPVPPEYRPDLGERLDLLYHCCNPDVGVNRFARVEFAHTRMVYFEDDPQAPTLRTICEELEVPAEDITWLYRRLQAELDTEPNTGLVAITHLLAQPIASLKLFGLTFFREPYYPGYPGHGAAPVHWRGGVPPTRIWRHRLDVQFQHFVRSLASDPRLAIDERSSKIMGL